MLTRLIPKMSWLARYSIAYIVGVFAGLRAYNMVQSYIFKQIKGFTELALYGYTVMARISLLIGRFDKLIEYSSSQYH